MGANNFSSVQNMAIAGEARAGAVFMSASHPDYMEQSHILQTLNYNFQEHVVAVTNQRVLLENLQQVCHSIHAQLESGREVGFHPERLPGNLNANVNATTISSIDLMGKILDKLDFKRLDLALEKLSEE